jgi:hypothetical protein
MKRTVAIILFLSFAIIGLSFLFYWWINNQENKQYKPIDAISPDASIILKIDNFETFVHALKSNRTWNGIDDNKQLETFASIIDYLDSAARFDNTIRTITTSSSTIAAFYDRYPKENEFCISINIPQDLSKDDVLELVRLHGLGLAKTEEVTIDGNSGILVDTKKSGTNSIFAFTVYGNLLLVSNSQELIVESIKKLKLGQSANTDELFSSVYQTAANGVVANIFINPNELSKTISSNQNTNLVKGLAAWISLDVIIEQNIVQANGLILLSNNKNEFYKIFTHQKPVNFSLRSYLLAKSKFFVWYGIPQISTYLTDYMDYIDELGLSEPYNKNLSEFLGKTGISLEEFLNAVFDGEVSTTYCDFESKGAYWYMLVNTKSGSGTIQQIERISKSSLEKETFKPDKNYSFIIAKNPIRSYLPILFGNNFLNVYDEYFTVIDNVIVFGPSVESLKLYIEEHLRSNTLAKNSEFSSVLNRVSTTSNLLYYSKGFDSPVFETLKIHNEDFKLTNEIKSSSRNILWQVVGGSQKLFSMLVLQSGNGTVKENKLKDVRWVCKLLAEPFGKPYLLKNHINGEFEVLVQDINNNIYLISKKGHILWKRTVDSKIIGNVRQVDIYRNGKLQMAFATSKKIYVIDRNGKDVTGFPVELVNGISSPLSVFDYENNREYRLFVASPDKHIYCFDKKGKMVEGWLKPKTETVVTTRIGYVKRNGKDYIVVFDKNRPYLLNRRGQERVKIKSLFTKAKNSEFYLDRDSKGYHIVTTDTLGVIHRLYLDGTVEQIGIEPLSSKHTFQMSDNQYFFADENKLSIYTKKAEPVNIAISSLGDFDENSLQVLEPEGMVLLTKNQNIYGYNFSGNTLPNFPVPGTTPLIKIDNQNKSYVTLSKHLGVVCINLK